MTNETANGPAYSPSYLEFIIDPLLLSIHCEKIKNDQEVLSSGADLIRKFLEMSATVGEGKEAQKKSAVLSQFAARTALLLEYTVEDIESTIPLGFQRSLLCAMKRQYGDTGSEIALLNEHRWILRYSINSCPLKHLSSNTEYLAPTAAEISESAEWIKNWLRNSVHDTWAPSLVFSVLMEMVEYSFSKHTQDDYKMVIEFFDKAKQLSEAHPCLLDSRAANISATTNYMANDSNVQVFDRCSALRDMVDLFLVSPDVSYVSPSIKLRQLLGSISGDSPRADVDAHSVFEEILGFLIQDSTTNQLGWSLRASLETDPRCLPIRCHIFACNLIWKVIHTTSLPQVIWLSCTDFLRSSKEDLESPLLFFFVKAHDLYSTFDVTSPISKRLETLITIVLQNLLDTDMAIRLATLTPNFAPLLGRFELLYQTRRQHQDYVEVLKKKGPVFAQSDPLITAMYTNSIDTLIESVQSVGVPYVDNVALKGSLLYTRAREFERAGQLSKADHIYSHLASGFSLNYELGNEVPWRQLTSSLKLSISSNAHGRECSSDANIQTEALVKQIVGLLDSNIKPSKDNLEDLFISLMEACQWDNMIACSKAIEEILKPDWLVYQELLSCCHLASCLAEFIPKMQEYAKKRCSRDSTEWGDQCAKDLASSFELMLFIFTREGSLIQPFEWLATRGFLSKISNVGHLALLCCVFGYAAQFLHDKAKIQRQFHPERHAPDPDLLNCFEWLQSCKATSLRNESAIISLYKQTLSRQLCVDMVHPGNVLSIGDIYYSKGQYEKSVFYFLLGSSLESKYWTADDLPRGFTLSLPKMIHAFTKLKLYPQAAILHQFCDPVNYRSVFKLVARHIQAFNAEEHFEHIWKIPVLEALVHANKNSENIDNVKKLVSIMQKFELNEFNPPALRLRVEEKYKKKFLNVLTRQFLIKKWPGTPASSGLRSWD